MAKLVVHLRIPPSEYWALTQGQRQALITEWNTSQRRKG